MSDQKLSRRDWFRLHKVHQNKLLTEPAAASSTSSPLKAIDHPVNHDGMDLSQLPPMSEAELIPQQLGQLIEDIRQLGTKVTLMFRGISNPGSVETAGSATDQQLAALAELFAGRLNRIQIRYQWDGVLWIDTIENRNGNFRLVRIRHEVKCQT